MERVKASDSCNELVENKNEERRYFKERKKKYHGGTTDTNPSSSLILPLLSIAISQSNTSDEDTEGRTDRQSRPLKEMQRRIGKEKRRKRKPRGLAQNLRRSISNQKTPLQNTRDRERKRRRTEEKDCGETENETTKKHVCFT